MAIKAPTNLKITRVESYKFKITWKLGQNNYGAQELVWYENYKSDASQTSVSRTKHTISIGNKTTEASFTISYSNYPITGKKRLYTISAHVRGKIGKVYSSWANFTYDVMEPYSPKSLSKPGVLGSNANEAVYSWDITNNNQRVWSVFQYQFAEVTNYTAPDLNEIAWGTDSVTELATTTAKSITQAVTSLPTGGSRKTQFFRIRSYGPQGFSAWNTSYHVFGAPYKAVISEASAFPSGQGYIVSVTWASEVNKYGAPIDSTVVQSAVEKPVVNRTVEGDSVKFSLSLPASANWTARSVLKDTSGVDSQTFTLDSRPQDNECLFVRVNNQHDTADTTAFGDATLTKIGEIYGRLATPTLTSSSYDPTTRMVTISINSNVDISNSYTAVFAKADDMDARVIGVIQNGVSTETFAVPDDIADGTLVTFGAQNLVADYSPATPVVGSATIYSITTPALMESYTQWAGGTVARPPELRLADIGDGTILAEWDWPWTDAQSAELSWSTDQYAWESTDEPTTYIVNNNKSGRLRIKGLDYTTYYVRIRLIKTGPDYETYGLYSDPVAVTLIGGVPSTPMLVLDPTVTTPSGEIRCTWSYGGEEGSTQLQADIAEVVEDEPGVYSYNVIAHTDSAQSLILDLNVLDLGWNAGETHRLAVRTISDFMTFSAYSTPVSLRIAEPLEVDLQLGQGFVDVTETIGGETVTRHELKSFPFSITVTGAGENGSTSLVISRTTGHVLARPDGKNQAGFADETIVLVPDDADGVITVERDDSYIYGTLDDTEDYTITVMATDEFGQSGSESVTFTVNWDKKAYTPAANIEIDYDENVAFITPYVPDTTAQDIQGATCDIYRLSSGKPELVYSGASFDVKYVDLYPSIGRFGGYRIVYRTEYGDYISEDNTLAWTDYGFDDGAAMNIFDAIINFGDESVSIPFNLDLSHTWSKDFNETRYLGGSIQGDWNEGVSHTLDVNTEVAVAYQSATYLTLRRLADYSGVCHIRTPDGSSFAANVEVSENQEQKQINMLAKFRLKITRVDQESVNGMLYSEWIANA